MKGERENFICDIEVLTVKKKYLGLIFIFFIFALALLGGDYVNILLKIQSVDNTNHGWEVRRNNNHVQPEIPQKAREAVLRYNCIYAGSTDKKKIYLTIDLGYESGNTGTVLDVLKKNNVKATFFIIGKYLDCNPALVDRIVGEGHSLQNHTSNYKHLNTLSDYQIEKEIMSFHDAVAKRYGITMKYLRTPYEEWSDRILDIANRLGYKTVFWSAACYDWVEGRDVNYIYKSIMDNFHNGAIILIHAVSKSSPEAIDLILKSLKGKGFEFSVLDM